MIFIYALVDPRTGGVRYVGKATNVQRRLFRHMGTANLSKKHHSANWLRSLKNQGLRPNVQILQVLESDDDWQSAERAWIKWFRDDGVDLTNILAGGEGNATYGRLGKKNSPEHIAKCRAARIGKPVKRNPESSLKRADGVRRYHQRCKEEGIKLTHGPCSEERKRKIGDANRGRKFETTQAMLDGYEKKERHIATEQGSTHE